MRPFFLRKRRDSRLPWRDAVSMFCHQKIALETFIHIIPGYSDQGNNPDFCAGKTKNSSLNFSDVCFVGPVPPSFPSCFSLVKILLDLLDLPNWGWSGPFFSPVPSVSGFFLAWWVIGTSPVPGVCGTPFKLTLLFMPYKYGDDPNYLHVNVHPPSSLSLRKGDLIWTVFYFSL